MIIIALLLFFILLELIWLARGLRIMNDNLLYFTGNNDKNHKSLYAWLRYHDDPK